MKEPIWYGLEVWLVWTGTHVYGVYSSEQAANEVWDELRRNGKEAVSVECRRVYS